MLYELSGLELTEDPYVGIGDLNRDHGKSLLNMIINAAYRKRYREEGVTKAKAKTAIDAVQERHHDISNSFFTGRGLQLMNYDSQIQ